MNTRHRANVRTHAPAGSPRCRDEKLIARVLTGERDLFQELVQPYQRAVYPLVLRILRNRQEAEDAAQDTLLKALKNLHRFRAESKFSSWLISIALNEARCRLRRNRILRFESLDDTAEDGSRSFTPVMIPDTREVPLQALERKELRQTLEAAIAGLPGTYREVLLLRDVEELSIRETAALLSVTEGVVKTRLLRARLMMRKTLFPQGADLRNAPPKREKSRPVHPDYSEPAGVRAGNERATIPTHRRDLTDVPGQPLPYWQDIDQQVAQM